MNIQETLRLIKTLRAIQPAQIFDDDTPEVWQALLRNVDISDAVDAVEDLAGQETFIGTADILRQVRKMRNDRLGKIPADLFIPPAGLTDREERQWAKLQRTRAIAGISHDELAKQQHRGQLTSRPNLPLLLEAVAPAQHEKAPAVRVRHEIAQAEIDAAMGALASAMSGGPDQRD